MWGNKRGWLIAIAMLCVMAITIAMAYMFSSRRTEPTDFSRDPSNLAEVQLPTDPRTLLPPQGQTGDARDLYWIAIDDYGRKTDAYERVVRAFDLKPAVELDGVKSVLKAADYQKGSLFDGRVEAAVGYGTRPGVGSLQAIGGICARIGTEYAKRNQFDDARKYLNAAYVLGYRLFQERMTRLQLSASLGLMAHSVKVLSQIAMARGEKAEAQKYSRFYQDYQQYYRDRIEPVERVLTSVDPNVQAKHVGDVFEMADKSAERVWRVEAVLKLGMYKYYTNTPGDRRAAIRKVRSLLDNSDPAIATAAMAARELTIEQYRTLGAK